MLMKLFNLIGKVLFIFSLFIAVKGIASSQPVLVTLENGEVVDKGLALAYETDRKDSGFSDIVATGKIINKAPSGETNEKVFEMITVEVEGDGDRRFVKVTEPRTLRGTMFLSHAHALEADDVWVMLPRTSRMRRVATRDKTGRFLSSELTLEDISPWEIAKYSYRYIEDTPCGDKNQSVCHVIENTPAYEYSGYTRQIELLHSDIMHPYRIEYYGTNGLLLKILEFNNYEQFAGRYWRPMHMKMTNVVTGAESEIFWDEYKVKTGYESQDLSPTNLARLSR